MKSTCDEAVDTSLAVYCTLSAKEVLKELVPIFERNSGLTVNVTFAGGSVLVEKLVGASQGDLFIGPEVFTTELSDKTVLKGESRQLLARSTTGLAAPAGTSRLDSSSVESMKKLLFSAKTVSISPGASGIYFLKLLEELGISDAVERKIVRPGPGEVVGTLVADGRADIGVQQISEMLPVLGIRILPLPAELRQSIDYYITPFAREIKEQTASRFVQFLQGKEASECWMRCGLQPFLKDSLS